MSWITHACTWVLGNVDVLNDMKETKVFAKSYSFSRYWHVKLEEASSVTWRRSRLVWGLFRWLQMPWTLQLKSSRKIMLGHWNRIVIIVDDLMVFGKCRETTNVCVHSQKDAVQLVSKWIQRNLGVCGRWNEHLHLGFVLLIDCIITDTWNLKERNYYTGKKVNKKNPEILIYFRCYHSLLVSIWPIFWLTKCF